MDLTTLIYQHVVAALLATGGASAVIGWLARHWTVIGRIWNGTVALAGWVRKLGPAPAAPSDLEAILGKADPQTLLALVQEVDKILRIQPANQSETSDAHIHSNLP